MAYTLLNPPVHGGFKSDLRIHSHGFQCLLPNGDIAEHTYPSRPFKAGCTEVRSPAGVGLLVLTNINSTLSPCRGPTQIQKRTIGIIKYWLSNGMLYFKRWPTSFIIVLSVFSPFAFFLLVLITLTEFSPFPAPDNLFVYTWKHPPSSHQRDLSLGLPAPPSRGSPALSPPNYFP